MRALITGHRGFLGRHFKTELERRGYDVAGIDIADSPMLDCRDYFRECLRHGAEPDAWDLVVHCAAVVGGRETIDGDPLATAESLSIDAEMFRWAAVARPGRVLYISSSAAYPVMYQHGNPPEALHENDVWDCPAPERGTFWELSEPDQVYGWSKVTGELLADRLRGAGVPVTVVRPFSGYGEDQGEEYPFRALLERVRRRDNPVTVWGSGDQVRDWIHVDDVVAGALAVADADTTYPVNLCTGRPTSFLELARMMLRATGDYTSDIRSLPDKPSGVAYRVGDPARMHRYYRPRVRLEDGIERALGVVPAPRTMI